MHDERLRKEMRSENFHKNNGAVMRAVNMLRTKYVRVQDVQSALYSLHRAEILDSLHYLQEAGYIKLRSIRTKHAVELCDVDDEKTLEAKLSAKGIQLVDGEIHDGTVVV